MFPQHVGGVGIGRIHLLDGGQQVRRPCPSLHGARQYRAGADGARQHEALADSQSVLGQSSIRDRSGDAEREAEFAAFGRVPTDEIHVDGFEHVERTGHHLQEIVLHHGVRHQRHGGDGERESGPRTHGVEVVHGMVGADPPEPVGVVDHGPEAVAGHGDVAGGHLNDRGVVADSLDDHR